MTEPPPLGYCGEYRDAETGFIYLRARYYDPSIGRFTTEDPARDGLNWYAYCANNPVNFVDPWGMEYIVVSGGAYKKDREGDYNYEFIETAIKKLRELKDLKDGENLTWIIANEGWSSDDRSKFTKVAQDIGANLIYIDHKDEMIEYINNKTDNSRDSDKIKKFVVFSHGLQDNNGTISLGYNYDDKYNKNLNFSKSDIAKLSSTSFDNPNSAFYSCNLGTSGKSSFAQAWSNKVNGNTWAFVKKSSFTGINSGFHPFMSISRKKHGFSYYGSVSYPSPGNGASFVLFTPQ